jgi:hypothetical protein
LIIKGLVARADAKKERRRSHADRPEYRVPHPFFDAGRFQDSERFYGDKGYADHDGDYKDGLWGGQPFADDESGQKCAHRYFKRTDRFNDRYFPAPQSFQVENGRDQDHHTRGYEQFPMSRECACNIVVDKWKKDDRSGGGDVKKGRPIAEFPGTFLNKKISQPPCQKRRYREENAHKMILSENGPRHSRSMKHANMKTGRWISMATRLA